MSPFGDLAQRKTDYWRTNEGKNLKKIANPKTFSVEQCVFRLFIDFQPLYCFRGKCVGNWKSEILRWAHYLVRNKKIVKFCVYRPCSLDMRHAYASCPPPPPPGPPPPARPVPPCNTWPSHATETHRAYQWEIGRLVDGVGDGKSPAHAPRFPYRLGINGTVWGFGLSCKYLREY